MFFLMGAIVGCAITETGPDAPWVGPLQFTPTEFKAGVGVLLSFDYRNIRGGINNSTVYLDYKGSLGHHTRNRSNFGDVVKKAGGATENGTLHVILRIAPTDPPPFDLTYFLRIKDAEGRWSNEASGTVAYKAR